MESSSLQSSQQTYLVYERWYLLDDMSKVAELSKVWLAKDKKSERERGEKKCLTEEQ